MSPREQEQEQLPHQQEQLQEDIDNLEEERREALIDEQLDANIARLEASNQRLEDEIEEFEEFTAGCWCAMTPAMREEWQLADPDAYARALQIPIVQECIRLGL